MSKILVVVGSGNVPGNTDQLSDAFIKGAKGANHDVTKIILNKNFLGCQGCQACQHNVDINVLLKMLCRTIILYLKMLMCLF